MVEGSTIIMTPTAFVMEEAWEEMTPFVIKGIRSIDIVKANPQWWVLEVFDGFGRHVSSYKAMKMRYKIIRFCHKKRRERLVTLQSGI
jgi:hypothetical protein